MKPFGPRLFWNGATLDPSEDHDDDYADTTAETAIGHCPAPTAAASAVGSWRSSLDCVAVVWKPIKALRHGSTTVFGSERLTGALLDRLTHHVHILEMNGDSYRLAHSKRRSRRARPEPPPENAPPPTDADVRK